MRYKKTIKDLDRKSRPDDKLLEYGPKALTDAELLAVILRTGTIEEHSVELCERILSGNRDQDNSILNIFNYDYSDLLKIKGIGKVKALQIKSIAELSLRIAQSSAKEGLDFNNPETIACYYMEQLRHKKREEVVLLMMNSAGKLIDDISLFEGTVNSSVFSPREIFQEALKRDAVNIILLHNHPSGLPEPSRADLSATKLIAKAGNLIGIPLLDHIIIGDRKYISLRAEGYMND